MTVDPSRPPVDQSAPTDLPAAVGFGLGAAFLGIGLAASLAALVGFPGTDVAEDVVGYLSTRQVVDKGAEAGLFYYSLVLAPFFAALGFFLAVRLTRTEPVGAFLLLSGLAAVVPGAAGLLSGRTGWLLGVLVPFAILATGGASALLVPGAPGRFVGSMIGAVRRRLAGAGSTFACGVSLTVLALAAGPRIPGGLSLAANGIRVAGTLAAGLAVAWGIAWMVQHLLELPQDPGGPLVAPAVSRAMRHGLWLILGRLWPDSVVLLAVVLALAVSGFCFSLWRHRRARPSAEEARKTDARFVALRFLPALVLVLVFHDDVNGGIDLYHAGEWLTPAAEMAAGEAPYRDIYLQHGLIQNALRSYLTFSLLEPTFAADRLSDNFMFAAAHAAFLLLLLVSLRSRLLALALALALATPGLFLSPRFIGFFLALAFVVVDIRQARDRDGLAMARRHRWPLYGAGGSASLALFWSLDSGIYVGLAIVSFLALEAIGRRGESFLRRLAPFGSLATGAFLGALPFVLYLLQDGALTDFFVNSVDQARLQLSVWGVPFPSAEDILNVFRDPGVPSPLGDGRVVALLAAGTFIATPAILLVLAQRGRFSRTCYVQLLLALAGASLFRTALGRSDGGHLAYVAALLWPILALAAERALSSRPLVGGPPSLTALLRGVPLVLLVAYLVGAFAPLYGMTRQWTRLSEVRPDRPGGGFCYAPLPRVGEVLVPELQARALVSMAAFFDERLPKGAPIFAFSNMGAIYFFLERDCPTRYVMPVYAATPDMQRRLIADLEEQRPLYMVTSDLLGYDPVDGVPLAERLPLVAEYLAASYRFSSNEGFGVVYELRGSAGEGRER